MSTLIQIELYKTFRKWRTYIGFIAFTLLIPIIEYAVYAGGHYYLRSMMRSLQDNFLFVGNLLNGWFVSFIIMQAMYIHVPFFITLVAGDLLAGEGSAGTYRVMLSRPISREQVIISKYITGLIYTFIFIVFFASLSLFLGFALLGSGELLVIGEKIIIFAADDVAWRFLLAYSSAFLGMSVVVSLALLFSSFVNNAIGPIIGTMAVIVIFFIFVELPFEIFEDISPYLFTKYMPLWLNFFDDPINWKEVETSAIVLTAHSAVLFLITLFTFKRKDILT